MLPPLQPTTISSPMPSRLRTLYSPMAAAHLTLPEPMTSVTRLACAAFPTSRLHLAVQTLRQGQHVAAIGVRLVMHIVHDGTDEMPAEAPDGSLFPTAAQIRHRRL